MITIAMILMGAAGIALGCCARRRYMHLIREAKRLGMSHLLLEDREHETV